MTQALIKAGYSVRGLANWILDFADNAGVGISNMGLNKLIFFAVEAVLISQKKLLTNAKIEAWEHGPVFREVYHNFKRYGDKPIVGRASFFSQFSGAVEVSTLKLSPEDEKAIRLALAPLIKKSAFELRKLSHVKDGAWHRVWWYDGYANPGMEITPESILQASVER